MHLLYNLSKNKLAQDNEPSEFLSRDTGIIERIAVEPQKRVYIVPYSVASRCTLHISRGTGWGGMHARRARML